MAERQAHEIVDDAREREREIRLGAEDYADEVLGNLEANLDKFLAAVRRGRERLQTPAIGPSDEARRLTVRRASALTRAGLPPAVDWSMRRFNMRSLSLGERNEAARRLFCDVAPFDLGGTEYEVAGGGVDLHLTVSRVGGA